MPKIVRIGNTEYREVSRSKPYRRRYSPKRDSGVLFKSPAQKAYESRKNLEYIRNKRHLESEREQYKSEERIRRDNARMRRKQRYEQIKAKSKALYNKDVHLPKFLHRKKKPESSYPYGGFESARKE